VTAQGVHSFHVQQQIPLAYPVFLSDYTVSFSSNYSCVFSTPHITSTSKLLQTANFCPLIINTMEYTHNYKTLSVTSFMMALEIKSFSQHNLGI
jgi:hypothetical protein